MVKYAFPRRPWEREKTISKEKSSMPKYLTVYDVESKTYALLFSTAWHLLDTAENVKEGSLLNLQTGTVFFAFAFEAYLNHVGDDELKFWAEIDRISYDSKLTVLSEHLGFEVDKSRRPFQTIRELFDLRNAFAHGRTKKLEQKKVVTNGKPDNNATWRLFPEEQLTTEIVRRYHDDVESAVETINENRQRKDEYLWHQGSRYYTRTPV